MFIYSIIKYKWPLVMLVDVWLYCGDCKESKVGLVRDLNPEPLAP